MGEGTLYMKVKEILVYQMITNIIRFEWINWVLDCSENSCQKVWIRWVCFLDLEITFDETSMTYASLDIKEHFSVLTPKLLVLSIEIGQEFSCFVFASL
jgi:hypothetical protein